MDFFISTSVVGMKFAGQCKDKQINKVIYGADSPRRVSRT